jgi:hypothetical protein
MTLITRSPGSNGVSSSPLPPGIFFTYLLPLLLVSTLCATCNHQHFEGLGRSSWMALVYKEGLIGYLTFD